MATHMLFDKLIGALMEANDLGNATHILEWDSRTYMPTGAAMHRAVFSGRMEGRAHAAFTKDEVGTAIEACLGVIDELTDYQKLMIHRLKLSYDRAKALPQMFVERKKKITGLAMANWKMARAANDYSMFEPHLAEVLKVVLEEAELLGGEAGNADSLYDQLLSGYEPGMKTEQVRTILSGVGTWQAKFMKRIQESAAKPKAELLTGCFPKGQQRLLIEAIVSKLGYDFERGNLSEATHPFMSTIGHGDHRITTRFYEDDLKAALFGGAHEAGHAMYEQGAPGVVWQVDNSCLLISLGIHESQSRMWENFVCRSKPFWEYWFRSLQMMFPVCNGCSLDEFYAAINTVLPSAIRVESDEATYNGHILALFETELAFVGGTLSTKDAPEFFADRVFQYVGYSPTTFSEGILQDVHWSSGGFGYFPTYTLGNLCGGQFFATFAARNSGWAEQFRQGDFSSLLNWLRENVHATGHFESMDDVLKRVTGEGLNPTHWQKYMEDKFFPLYPV